MQLLVPPLEDSSCRGDFGSKTGDVSTSNSTRSRSVMSQGLQDKFEAMEHTWNQSRTSTGATKRSESSAAAPASSSNVAAAAAGVSAAEPETNQGNDDSHHQKKKRKIATETAFAIESEVQKWQRGIAELEAMLEKANGGDLEVSQRSSSSSSSSLVEGDALARPPEVVRFPSLPPIIPAEEGDLEGSNCNNNEDENELNDHHHNAIDGDY